MGTNFNMRVLNALRYDGKESVDGSVVPEAANVQKLLDGLDRLQRGEPADVLKHLCCSHPTMFPIPPWHLLARYGEVCNSECRLPEHVLLAKALCHGTRC